MARYKERYVSERGDHGIGEIARRNAEADYRDKFDGDQRTQNYPDDYGTRGNPEPFERGYLGERRRYGERYGADESSYPGRDWRSGPDYDHPGRRGDAGMGRAYSGQYESLQRNGPAVYGERAGREQAGGYHGRGPKNYTRSDARIQEDISERLWDADDVDASDVSVEVKQGEVTLRGNVERRSIRHRIEDIADACGGVKDIHNEIRVQPRNEWPYDKGVAPGTTDNSRGNPKGSGRGEGMVQSASEQTPSHE